jgi:DNA-damage-inducible protein J
MMDPILSAPKTDMFRFRINPDIRAQVEAVYAKNGLTFTQAINIFIQQSLNAGGFPFQVNEENAELVRARSMERLMKELDAGKNSGELVDEADVYRMLEVTPE